LVDMNIQNTHRIILSKPKNTNFTRIEILSDGKSFQATQYTETKVFHKNISYEEIEEFVKGCFGVSFFQLNAWDGSFEYQQLVSKKGKISESKKPNTTKPKTLDSNSFNRTKHRMLSEDDSIPVLEEIGVFTKEKKVAKGKQDKFRQINRYLELLNDITKNISGTVNIIDFGSGKSYLTLLLHHFYSNQQGVNINICGMDINPDVVNDCNAVISKHKLKNIKFVEGDISKLETPPFDDWGNGFNIVLSLHACDTATDYAIFNAIKWSSDLICVVPCCQHELRNQMKPENLAVINKHGIIKERFSSLMTDLIRAELLECAGYKSQIIEFAPFENTPKNLFIRAVKNNHGKSTLESIKPLLEEFNFEPTLLKLLRNFRYADNCLYKILGGSNEHYPK